MVNCRPPLLTSFVGPKCHVTKNINYENAPLCNVRTSLSPSALALTAGAPDETKLHTS